MSTALTATEAHAQTANRIDINDNWMMQESSVLLDKGRREGWFEENSAGQTQEGRVLSATTYQPDGWYKATVPGTVLTTLVDNGVYAEPLYGENNRPEKIPESLCHTDWWYRTVVDIPQSYAGKNIWLNFDGINYSADVWVNGRRVGPIKGAFIRGTFDITPYVKAGGKAAIAVCISPQPHTGTPSEHTMGTVGGPCGGVGRLDGPTFGCSNGWDWRRATTASQMLSWTGETTLFGRLETDFDMYFSVNLWWVLRNSSCPASIILCHLRTKLIDTRYCLANSSGSMPPFSTASQALYRSSS